MCFEAVSGVFVWFSRFTSIPGFSQARESDNKCSRLAWAILFILGVCATILGVKTSIASYLEYRSVTTITNEFKSTLMFPSVTICNLNKVHCGNLYEMIARCEKVIIHFQLYRTINIENNCHKFRQIILLHSFS